MSQPRRRFYKESGVMARIRKSGSSCWPPFINVCVHYSMQVCVTRICSDTKIVTCWPEPQLHEWPPHCFQAASAIEPPLRGSRNKLPTRFYTVLPYQLNAWQDRHTEPIVKLTSSALITGFSISISIIIRPPDIVCRRTYILPGFNSFFFLLFFAA